MKITLIKGDCLKVLPTLEKEAYALALNDLPYGTIKGLEIKKFGGKNMSYIKRDSKSSWDEVIPFNDLLPKLYNCIQLKGRSVFFAQYPFTAQIYNATHSEGVKFNQSLVWAKEGGGNPLKAKTTFLNRHEDILVYSKQYTRKEKAANVYSMKILDFIGQTALEVRKAYKQTHKGDALFHFFYPLGALQFTLCSQSSYQWLIDTYKIDKMPGFLDYKSLKDLNDLDKKLQTFNLPEGKKSRWSVLQFQRDYRGEHPTAKPVPLLVELIETYTNKGENVLDPTMGSGSSAIACIRSGRSFTGIEMDEHFFEITKNRVLKEIEGIEGVTLEIIE